MMLEQPDVEQPPNPHGAEVIGQRIPGSAWPTLATCVCCGAVISWLPGQRWTLDPEGAFPDDPRDHAPDPARVILHPPADVAGMWRA